ncbi:MAG: site-specific DNA-methyltransferase [Bacteroidales bacterium]|nr:site-specific DNA-methyltransferase [Candidatus Colimorpha onthohippi]
MAKPERLELQSADGVQLNLDALYQIAPSCFTEAPDPKTGKIKRMVNFDILRQLLGDDSVEDAPEAYEFNWVGKQAARADVLRPINKTLRPVKEDSVDWDNTQNLYIEGDNLEVLKLLQKSYLGKVKMIYIDPPYNTGNDFVYHDDFAQNQAEYDEASGAVDELGNRYYRNTDSNGRYHSDWCSMIYSRLMLARKLLTEDGVIFISIDDNEVENLRKICDEVYGGVNFVAQLIWQRAFAPKNDARFVSNSHDYVLMFAKNIEQFKIGRLDRTEEANARYSNPDNDPRGVWTSGDLSVKTYSQSGDYSITTPSGKVVNPPSGGCWRFSQKEFEERVKDNRIWFGANGDNTPRIKRFLSELKFEGMAPTSILFHKDVGHSQEGAKEVVSMFDGVGVFDGPKPTRLMKHLMILANLKDDSIVLDFFSGSATTAHALMLCNAERKKQCKFILTQIPEKIDGKGEKFGYKNICEIGKERIRRAGKKIKEENPDAQDLDIGFRVFRVDSSNFEEVEHTPKEWSQAQLDLFLNNIKSDRDDLDLLFGCMLDWGVKLSLPMTSEEVDGKMIYTVNDGDLVACFADDVTENVVKAMADKMPLRVIFRDSCFSEDSAKINIYETFKQLMDWSDQEVVKNIRVI